MSKKQKAKKRAIVLTATKFRILLSLILIVILAGTGVGFYFAHDSLNEKAAETSQIQTEAEASDDKVAQLQQMEIGLERHRESAKKAEKIVSDAQKYQYQNQVIRDLTQYAIRAGIPLGDISFVSSSSSAPAAASSSETSSEGDEDSSSGGSESNEQSQPSQSTALKTETINISTSNRDGANYNAFLKFLMLLENNLTQIQVTDVELQGDPDNKSNVMVNSMSIKVYMK